MMRDAPACKSLERDAAFLVSFVFCYEKKILLSKEQLYDSDPEIINIIGLKDKNFYIVDRRRQLILIQNPFMAINLRSCASRSSISEALDYKYKNISILKLTGTLGYIFCKL